MIRTIIFDLDGTLANTASLTAGRRLPSLVLGICPPGTEPTSLSFGAEVSQLPGRLIAGGYDVGILTASPSAYASTLLGLLNIDYQFLLPSAGKGDTREKNLASLINQRGALPREVLYIGDTEGDLETARNTGVHFEWPQWLHGGPCRLTSVDEVLRMPKPLKRYPELRLNTEPGLLDHASHHLLKSTATAEEVEALYLSGLWSLIVEHDAIAKLRNPDHRLRLSGNIRPWSLMLSNKTEWDSFIESGDLGRILDVSANLVSRRLPNPTLNKAIQGLSDRGAYVVLSELWDSLDPQLRERIAKPKPRTASANPIRSTLEKIVMAINDSRPLDEDSVLFLQSAEVSPSDAARTAGYALTTVPHQKHRRMLQQIFLTGLSEAARDCVIEDVRISNRASTYREDFLSATILKRAVTLQELDLDSKIHEEAMRAIFALFPPVRVMGYPSIDVPIHACVTYRSIWGEGLLPQAKDWKNRERLRSGQFPFLGLLWLPSFALAAAAVNLYDRQTALIPVPSTPFSTEQPTQFSERIAHSVAKHAHMSVEQVLAKNSNGSFEVTHQPFGRQFILVDDQITRGNSIGKALEALKSNGIAIAGVITWSTIKQEPEIDEQSQPKSCWWNEGPLNYHHKPPCPRHN